MRTPKTSDAALLDKLALLFRERGYEGASLSRIAEATGLQRASLYHRFPGGKREMALAVLDHVHRKFAEELLAPLESDAAPATKVRQVGKKLQSFYEDGRRNCLIDTLSLGEDDPEIREAIASALGAVVGALGEVAKEAGHPPATARRLGEEALLRVQGSLVLSRVTGEAQAFRRVLKELPELLCG